MLTIENGQKLQMVLGENATTELRFEVAYTDFTPATNAFTPGTARGTSNDTTDVDMVAAPAAATYRQLKFMSIVNGDGITHSVTVKKDVGGTDTTILSCTLETGEALYYEASRGFYVRRSDGSEKSGVMGPQGEPGTTLGVVMAMRGGWTPYL